MLSIVGQSEILQLLGNRRLSSSQMFEEVECSIHALRRSLAKLVTDGYVKKHGNKNSHYREGIQYSLTERGHNLIA